MHTPSTYDTFGFGGYLTGLSIIGHYVEIIVECIGQVAAHLRSNLHWQLGRDAAGSKLTAFFLPVHKYAVFTGVQQKEWVYLEQNSNNSTVGSIDGLCGVEVMQLS